MKTICVSRTITPPQIVPYTTHRNSNGDEKLSANSHFCALNVLIQTLHQEITQSRRGAASDKLFPRAPRQSRRPLCSRKTPLLYSRVRARARRTIAPQKARVASRIIARSFCPPLALCTRPPPEKWFSYIHKRAPCLHCVCRALGCAYRGGMYACRV